MRSWGCLGGGGGGLGEVMGVPSHLGVRDGL